MVEYVASTFFLFRLFFPELDRKLHDCVCIETQELAGTIVRGEGSIIVPL